MATVEPHRTTQTRALVWDVSPKWEVEVEQVGNTAKRPPLGVVAYLCTKDPADSTCAATQIDRRRLLKKKVSRWGCSLGPKTPWFYWRSA